MKKIFFVILMLLSTNVFANNRFYIGVGAQQTNINSKIQHTLYLVHKDVINFTEQYKKNNYLYNINIGYKINFKNNFFITPEFTYNFVNDLYEVSDISKDLKMKELYSLNLKFGYNILDKLSFGFLVGTSRVSDLKIIYDVLNRNTKLNLFEDDYLLNLGITTEYLITNNISSYLSFIYSSSTSKAQQSDVLGDEGIYGKFKNKFTTIKLGFNYYF